MNSEDQKGTSLKQMFQNLCPEGSSVIEGTVTTASPLQITLANDAKMILSANSLIIPRHLTNYSTTVSLSKGAQGSVNGPVSTGGKLTDFALSGSITVHDALAQGDTVYLLSFNYGKKYYVLDRKG